MAAESDKKSKNSSSGSKQVKHIEHSEYTLWLPEEFDSLSDIEEILTGLYDAEEEDTIKLHIGGYGGSVHLGLKLLAAMEACEGKIINIVDSPVHSMHSVIAVNGVKAVIHPSVYFHFHSMSYIAYGKHYEIKSQADYMEKWIKDLDRRYLSHVLNKKELEEIAKGKELYLSYKDMSKRLSKLQEKTKVCSADRGKR